MEISVRQAEGLSLARSQGMTKDVKRYFDLLENQVSDRPQHIFNVDGTGLR
jgi:hypothetical protein